MKTSVAGLSLVLLVVATLAVQAEADRLEERAWQQYVQATNEYLVAAARFRDKVRRDCLKERNRSCGLDLDLLLAMGGAPVWSR